MMRSNTADQANYNFSTPYPKPQFDYPTAHSRTNVTSSSGTRSPSPTPSEIEEANQPFISRKLFTLGFYKRPKVILFVFIGILIGVFSVLITIYHKQIEDWLRPAANWMQQLKFGYLIPIAILFVISFPPLFGHEIVAVLAGNVWGLWEGFGIVCAGTLLGEIGNFYAFKYLCTSRGDKLERSSFFYGCLARTVREGGFFVAVMARLSVIPGHFTTAVFATCGMNIFVFILAAILSLPKQFVTVYLGVLLEQSADGTSPKNSKLISDLVVVISVLITSVAMWYILRKMKAHRLGVVRDRRKRLQGVAGMKPYGSVEEEGRIPLTGHRGHHESTSSLVSNDVFNPGISDAELAGHPLQVGYDQTTYGEGGRGGPIAPIPQRWDERGRAIKLTEEQNRYSAGYDDPYGYNSYPPPRSPPPGRAASGAGANPALAAAKNAAYGAPSSPPPNFRPTVSPFGAAAQQGPQPQGIPTSSPPPNFRPTVSPFGAAAHPQLAHSQVPPLRAFSPPAGPPPGVAARTTSPPSVQSGLPLPGPAFPSASASPTGPGPQAPLSIPPPASNPIPNNPPRYSASGPSPNSIPKITQQDSLTPESPFEDKHAIKIPPHVKRYQLSDGSNDFRSSQANKDGGHPEGEESEVYGHGQEATDSTFYSAHSRGGTEAEPDLR